ncbi:hypothetical protein G7046_g555 [Stylonectria norvegica]|nr:hypothetical protein G7046_g555 [Stylonectria norvegica]
MYSSSEQITPLSSKAASIPQLFEHEPPSFYPRTTLRSDLSQLFDENVVAKVYRTATRALKPTDQLQHGADLEQQSKPRLEVVGFPEYVPQEGAGAGSYVLREPEFWTCGFFPGTLYGMLERLVKFPDTTKLLGHTQNQKQPDIVQLRSEILGLCQVWSDPLHAMADRKDTHDIGFIIMPALRQDWELAGNLKSLHSIIRGARSLASRYVPSAGAIRSWDERIQKNLQITCKEENLIAIIDSLCNLDLLYYAASHCADGADLYDIATSHATTLLRTHLRSERTHSTSGKPYTGQWYSVNHVANLDPKTGNIKQQFTAQGYSDTSTWARGQSWGILGYAQTYMWTKNKRFLKASCGLAEYFLYRVKRGPAFNDAGLTEDAVDGASCKHHGGIYVPLWDFDAPFDDPSSSIRDSSAGAIAANGMLILSQALASLGYDQLATRFRSEAINLVRDLTNFAMAPEKAGLATGVDGSLSVYDISPGQTYEAIMKFGTANNNANARKQYANHGLVYGDYYLVEFGNKLLRMGLV